MECEAIQIPSSMRWHKKAKKSYLDSTFNFSQQGTVDLGAKKVDKNPPCVNIR